jgi:hypothetical protein
MATIDDVLELGPIALHESSRVAFLTKEIRKEQ